MRPRRGDGVICKIFAVCLGAVLGLEALTTNSNGRNISSTCNTSESAFWASSKNINPLGDANYHKEAIKFAYHQSPLRFSPICYQNPVLKSPSPTGQTILFGCPPEPNTVGELPKIPVLKYLLDYFHLNWSKPYPHIDPVSQKHRS